MQYSVFTKINHHPLSATSQHDLMMRHLTTLEKKSPPSHTRRRQLTSFFLWHYSTSIFYESHNSKCIVIKICLFIQENEPCIKRLKIQSIIKRIAKGVKALQLSLVVSQPFYSLEKGNRLHMLCVSGGPSSKSMTYYLEEKTQTKISLWSDYKGSLLFVKMINFKSI